MALTFFEAVTPVSYEVRPAISTIIGRTRHSAGVRFILAGRERKGPPGGRP
jgi:hypothetical protein